MTDLNTLADDRRLKLFMAKVEKTESCWNWTGAMKGGDRNRGSFWDGERQVLAYRWMYAHTHPGADMDGKLVMHSCDNPSCVNPDHLTLGTHSDNMVDMWDKDRGCRENIRKAREAMDASPESQVRGEKHGRAKLTEAQITYIRECGERAVDLAERFGVHPNAIWRVRRGARWKHLPTQTAGRK